MIIKLKGKLPEELTQLGLANGDKFHAYPSETGRADDVQIKFIRDHRSNVANVSKANYKIVYR